MKYPLDKRRYERDPRSQALHPDLDDGAYVFVQSVEGTVYVLPDGSHNHVKVLGDALPALYAGDMTIKAGAVKDMTNLSGTFQFHDAEGLLAVVSVAESLGIKIIPGAVRLFPLDGRRPIELR